MASLLQSDVPGGIFINLSQIPSSSPTPAIAQEQAVEDEDVIEDSIEETDRVRNTAAAQSHAEYDESAVVEDSMKDNTQAHRGGPVQSPLQRVYVEEDELYSVTPQRKVALGKRKASPTEISPQRHAWQQTLAYQSLTDGDESGEKQQHENVSTKSNPFNELFSRGAKARQPAEVAQADDIDKMSTASNGLKHRSADSEKPLVNGIMHRLDKVKADGSIRAVVEDSQERPKKKTQPVQRPADAKTNPLAYNNSVSKSPTKSNMSALEALQARRAAQGSGSGNAPLHKQSPSPWTAPQPADEAAGAKRREQVPTRAQQTGNLQGRKQAEPLETPISQLLSKNMSRAVQTQAREPGVEPETETRPTTGKLRSLRKLDHAQTPAVSSKASKRPIGVNDIRGHPSSEPGDLLNGNEVARKRRTAVLTSKGLLKRLARNSEADRHQKDLSSDSLDSSDTQGEYRPSKKARTAAKSMAKSVSKPGPKSKTKVRKKGVDETRSTSARTSGRTYGQSGKDSNQTATTGPRRSNVRTRMMAQNEVAEGRDAPQHLAAAADEPTVAPTGPRIDENKKNGGNIIPRATESLKDLERSVFDFGDRPGGQAKQETVRSDKHALAAANVSAANKQIETTDMLAVIHSEPPERVKSLNAPLGTSEDNAIELSDREELSSSLSPSQQEGHAPPASSDQKLAQAVSNELPKTPAAFPSSPPGNRRAVPTGEHGRVYDPLKSRPNIISFGRSGPLNQGIMSAKKDERYSVGTSRTLAGSGQKAVSSDVNARAGVETKRRNDPSSVATSMKPSKTTPAGQPPCVAPDVADALAGFTTKSHGKENIKDTRNSSDGPVSERVLQPQESLLLIDDGGFVPIDSFDEATFVTQATVPIAIADSKFEAESKESLQSKISTAPRPPQRQKLHRAPTVPSMVGHENNTGENKNVQSTMAPPKRRLDTSAVEQPSKKRARNDINHESRQAHLAENGVEDSSVIRADQATELSQKSNISMSAPSKGDFQKPVRVAAHGFHHLDSRKPTRVASHGSQKVDIHGSPVPEGFTVPEESTVLETFSQRAQLSSEGELTEISVEGKGTSDNGGNRPASEDGVFSSSRPLEPVSSNVKRPPAGPNEESQAITGYRKTDTKGPLVQHMAGSQPVDPFTSSEGAPRQPQQTTSVSFSEKLKKVVSASVTCGKATRHRPAHHEDPDETLVEAERPSLASNRQPSLSSSSSDTSTNTDGSTNSQHDLSVWRNALQPHQMNLFDELVTVSHRLVQHLVDRETAAANIVSDYRTRALQLVENMEATHAEQLRELKQKLTDRKKRLRREFSDCGKKLKACTASVRVEKRCRSGEESDDGGMERKLESLVAEYCYV